MTRFGSDRGSYRSDVGALDGVACGVVFCAVGGAGRGRREVDGGAGVPAEGGVVGCTAAGATFGRARGGVAIALGAGIDGGRLWLAAIVSGTTSTTWAPPPQGVADPPKIRSPE